jgi:RimJ/RimL family protein N-acetyltransferase
MANETLFPDIVRDDVFMLETPRLWLRWPRAIDAPAIVRFAGDPSVAGMTSRLPHPYPPEEADSFIFRARQMNATGTGLTLAIAPQRRPSDLVGVISAEPGPKGEAMIGYWLGRPHWGQGYGSEALIAILRAVFTLTEAPSAIAAVKTRNPASRRVLEKGGFVSDPDGAEAFASVCGNGFEAMRLDRADWTERSLWDGAEPGSMGVAARWSQRLWSDDRNGA